MLEDELKELRERCSDCNLCLKECEFLGKVFETPAEMRDKAEAGYDKATLKVPYSCTLCDFCGAFCPSELNMGEVYLQIRKKMVAEGFGPPPAAKKFVEIDQNRVFSDAFALSLPAQDGEETTRVFFPGCHGAGYSPEIVLRAYDHLRAKLPGTGIMLGCCGNPTRELGDEEGFQEKLRWLESEMQKLGATEMIVACPYCNYTFKNYGAEFEVTSIYEVLAEIGLPDDAGKGDWTFSLHDACRARWEVGMQDSVRKIVTELGYAIEEMQYSRELTHCCGMGGGISYSDMALQKTMTKNTVEMAPHDMLTYCVTCRETFAPLKPTLHVLDLVFNSDWKEAMSSPAHKPTQVREHQSALRAQLLEKFGK